MKIAVEGCAHGELDSIYDTIECLENTENMKIDLLICCGDFQASRNEHDLRSMAIPPKYYNMCSFYKYYSGEKLAPVLTIFIGGNHEASNYLQELPYGGWVAPRIYYLGYAGVINIAGIRIAGLSGIYKSKDYMKGHFELSPFDDSTKRSVYHVRNLEVFRLKQLSPHIDIFLSHDWPSNVTDYGNKEQLIRFKPHFKDDIERKELGSEPCKELLNVLKPSYWFAAHLHCKFAALIPHEDNKCTKFLALDKCLPKRRFMQVLDVPHKENEEIKIKYDLEWLTILVLTNHLLSINSIVTYMPGPLGNERYCFTPTTDEQNLILNKLDKDLTIPDNFIKTAAPYNPDSPKNISAKQSGPVQNPQTVQLCELFSIDDPIELILKKIGKRFDDSDLNLESKILNHSSMRSDSISEETSDDLSFINDTTEENLSRDEEKKSSMIRLNISLPEPKNEYSSLFFVDTDPWESKNSSKRSLTEKDSSDNENNLSKSHTNNENVLENCEPRKNCDDTSTSEVGNSASKKKLKRRNINLYKEDSD